MGSVLNFELLPRLYLILSEIMLIITLKLILAKQVTRFNSVFNENYLISTLESSVIILMSSFVFVISLLSILFKFVKLAALETVTF